MRIRHIRAFILPLIILMLTSQAFADFVDPPGCPGSSISYVKVSGQAIPDANSTGLISTQTVSGRLGFISDIDLSVFIPHAWSNDLDFTLTSPEGTKVVVSTDNGGSASNVFSGSLFDDRAGLLNPPGPVTDVTYATNVAESPIVPEQPFDAFYGQNPNGTWTLTVKDDLGGFVGTLSSWTLNIRTCSIPPNINTTTFAAFIPTPAAIPDNNATGITSNAFPNSSLGAFLCGVELFTNIEHSNAADLDIFLISPSGTEVTVSTDNGSSNDNVFAGTTWLNSAGNPVTDFVYSNGISATPLSPEESFAVLYGQNPNGVWQLKVVDDSAGGTGSLIAWSLTLKTCSNGPDGDGDGFGDSVDNCPLVSNPGQSDFDSDGAGDQCDLCFSDPNKSAPGDCGCGEPDVNSDGDTKADCIDACPVDPNKTASGVCGCGLPDINSDGDAAFNCLEECPNDPNKINAGPCGCGFVEKDNNKNGIFDCQANLELRSLLQSLSSQLKKVKAPKSSAQAKTQQSIAGKVKKLLKSLSSLVATPAGPLTTNNGTNLRSAVSKLSSAAKKALNTHSSSFAKDKKKALSSISSLNAAVPA